MNPSKVNYKNRFKKQSKIFNKMNNNKKYIKNKLIRKQREEIKRRKKKMVQMVKKDINQIKKFSPK